MYIYTHAARITSSNCQPQKVSKAPLLSRWDILLIINVFSPDVWNLNRCVEYWLKTSETESSWKLVQQILPRSGHLIFMLGHSFHFIPWLWEQRVVFFRHVLSNRPCQLPSQGSYYMTKSKPFYYREILQNLPYICINFDFPTQMAPMKMIPLRFIEETHSQHNTHQSHHAGFLKLRDPSTRSSQTKDNTSGDYLVALHPTKSVGERTWAVRHGDPEATADPQNPHKTG